MIEWMTLGSGLPNGVCMGVVKCYDGFSSCRSPPCAGILRTTGIRPEIPALPVLRPFGGDDNVSVVNFGCRLNSYEGEVIKQQAQAAGLEGAIIFNSCAVTSEAERQVRQAIRKARKANPTAKIIVTGCSAQINPQQYAEMEEVDKVIGNQEKLEQRVTRPFASPE